MSLDNYEIVKELGRGGMGAVFLANDKRLKRQVAIKVLKLPVELTPDLKLESINNFKREAVAIANLSHNNIVCVYDIGNQIDVHYIVMELIDGSPLSKILKVQGQAFHIDTVLKIADEICDALAYVHRNNVIHRDIKPENIIYTGKGISKLTDFGIAKFAGDENMKVGKPGDVKGTILYISPEQLQYPDNVDGRADMYSLGVSLYELLTGRLPFEGESPREVIMKILRDTPVAPSKIEPELVPHIDHVLLKALAKDPDKRYKNIEEFSNELKNVKDFLSRSSFQSGIRNMKKNDEQIYSQVAIEVPEDIVRFVNMLPDSGQQRFLYESEMLLSKYFEEFEDFINKEKKSSTESSSFDNDDSDNYNEWNKPKNILQPVIETSKSPFINSFSYITPKLTLSGKQFLVNSKTTGMTGSIDGIVLLSKINDVKTLKQIMDEAYPSEKIINAFNAFVALHQKGQITVDVTEGFNQNIFLGDIMVSLGMVTQYHLDACLNMKNRYSTQNKMIGEMLIDSGYLTRDKLLTALKIQHWYKRLFA